MKIITAIACVLTCSLARGQQEFSIFFDFNKHTLTAEARARLDSFINAEKSTTGSLAIIMNGHCDWVGPDGYNESLANKRVSTVKRFLESKGISKGSIVSATSHGERNPQFDNKTSEGRQLNRRVSIQVSNGEAGGSVTEDSRTLSEKIADTTTTAGTRIVLKNINFFGGSPHLLPESFSTLDELLEVMKRRPELVIEIGGHICCVSHGGDSPYSFSGNGLSEERARTIWAHLIGNGISEQRISYKGYGHSQPIYPYPEKSEAERVQNRRVEIKIITK